MSWQNGLYIEALQDLEPRALQAACKQIIRDSDRFPKPKEIRDLARELIERRDASRTLANPAAPADLGEVMRNEAILLLGFYHPECNTLLDAPSLAHKNFIAEAANVWGRVRPEGGLAEADAIRNGRRIYGFAMEAWARDRLNQKPLHPAFVNDKVREVYRQMTGQEIQTYDDTLEQGGLSDAVNRAVNAARRAAE